MKQLITLIILLTISSGVAFSQIVDYEKSVANIFKRNTSDIEQDIYMETGISQRLFYSCPDTIDNKNCNLKRKLHFDKIGYIVADTTFVDTLFSSTNRIFEINKIQIIKTHPSRLLSKYEYNTTIDSILIDALGRPKKLYINGILTKIWEYDLENRLTLYSENPEYEYNFKKSFYQYHSDTIIETQICLHRSTLDTSYNYLVFDDQKRLIQNVSKGQSITYKQERGLVCFDSIISHEIIPETVDVKYSFQNDSTIVVENNIFSIKQIIILDQNKEIKSLKHYEKDTILLSEVKFQRDSLKIIREEFNGGELSRTEILDLWSDGKTKCITKISKNSFERECASRQGMIIEKKILYGEYFKVHIYSVDIE